MTTNKTQLSPSEIASLLVSFPQSWLVHRIAPGLSRKQRVGIVVSVALLERFAWKFGEGWERSKSKRERETLTHEQKAAETADRLASEIVNLVARPRPRRETTGDIVADMSTVSEANDLSFADLLERNAQRRAAQVKQTRERIKRSGSDYTSDDSK